MRQRYPLDTPMLSMTKEYTMFRYSSTLNMLQKNTIDHAKDVPSMRIELTTLGLLDPRSNQLSYEGDLSKVSIFAPITRASYYLVCATSHARNLSSHTAHHWFRLSVPCSAERQHSPAKVSASITPLPLGIVAYLPTAIHMRLICRWTVCCPFNPMRERGESNPCSQSNTVHAACQNV